ncbi:MAG: AAA family ATPase [Christensenellaceae bacterium]|nr:AAA family ATPase [Christensenellaceae bacterium]
MYISKLTIEGYKNSARPSIIKLDRGLNILLGENGCGKTAIINALRLILKEAEAYQTFSEDDYYCSLDKKSKSTEIKVDAEFLDLDDDEKVTFLTWCDAVFNAHLHLSITENIIRPGYYKRRYWGGRSMASAFEEDTFDRIECIYLPPLRDAESKLSNGKRSRLALLLKKRYGDNTASLVDSVKSFQSDITRNTDNKYSEIDSVRKTINRKITETLGKRLGQSVNLQFSETTFGKIVENIRMVFFPHSDESDIDKFRDLATNSLGYNNLLYIATVFSELELVKDSDVFTVLLIEEPEAHLHPQLQVKFVKYLQQLSSTLKNAQIIVSTHSPVLASSIDIDRITHIAGRDGEIQATSLKEKSFGNDVSAKYINRWMDVTKSTMLFSKGIIFVEGIAEALILPRLGELVLTEYNSKSSAGKRQTPLAKNLEEMGVSIININGINFIHFMKLFGNFSDSSGPNIPIFCAGLTDRDPLADHFPLKSESVQSKNPTAEYIDKINENTYTRLFMSPLKTFEYELAMSNTVTLAKVLKDIWPTQNGDVSLTLKSIVERNGSYCNEAQQMEDAKYIYNHIDSSSVGKGLFAHQLAEAITEDFIIPTYIKKAILWACGGICDE